jgi:hypothetical protein
MIGSVDSGVAAIAVDKIPSDAIASSFSLNFVFI